MPDGKHDVPEHLPRSGLSVEMEYSNDDLTVETERLVSTLNDEETAVVRFTLTASTSCGREKLNVETDDKENKMSTDVNCKLTGETSNANTITNTRHRTEKKTLTI